MEEKQMMAQKIMLNTAFDAGSIEVVSLENPADLQFKIRADTNSHFAQWFYFQLSNVANTPLKLSFLDIDKTAYPDGWKDYAICVSYDNKSWFRVPTQLDVNIMNFELCSEADSVYFAYFEPYSYQQHLELIGLCNEASIASHTVLGQTKQGRNIDLITLGDAEHAVHKIWIIARQHPGETMAEWFMEGLIHRLIDEADSVSNTLLQDCVFYLVPNMNPDGAANGNLRVNTSGSNLNREWLTPSIDKSPEVFYVREKMMEVGCDMFFDIHGDEAIPYVFTAGCDDNPSFSDKQRRLDAQFKRYFEMINPDYQTVHGYEKGHFSTEMATVATNWVGDKFDCLSFTLEMPFKDNDNLPDSVHGWSGYRSYLLGQSMLSAIHMMIKSDDQGM